MSFGRLISSPSVACVSNTHAGASPPSAMLVGARRSTTESGVSACVPLAANNTDANCKVQVGGFGMQICMP